jgi:hypothetical protein
MGPSRFGPNLVSALPTWRYSWWSGTMSCHWSCQLSPAKARVRRRVFSNSSKSSQRSLRKGEKSTSAYVRSRLLFASGLFSSFVKSVQSLICRNAQEEELSSRTKELLQDNAEQVLQLLSSYAASSRMHPITCHSPF